MAPPASLPQRPLQAWNTMASSTPMERFLAMGASDISHVEQGVPFGQYHYNRSDGVSSVNGAGTPSYADTNPGLSVSSSVSAELQRQNLTSDELPEDHAENGSIVTTPSLTSSDLTQTVKSVPTEDMELVVHLAYDPNHPELGDPPTEDQGERRPCLCSVLGCPRSCDGTQQWIECASKHFEDRNIEFAPRSLAKTIPNSTHSAGSTMSWREFLNKVAQIHTDPETLLGSKDLDLRFFRFLERERLIDQARYKALIVNPFDQTSGPLTITTPVNERERRRPNV